MIRVIAPCEFFAAACKFSEEIPLTQQLHKIHQITLCLSAKGFLDELCPFCLRDGGLTEQLYIVGILPEQIPNFLHLLSDGVREIFFGSEVIETAAIQSGVLCHDASPTFAINSSMSFA